MVRREAAASRTHVVTTCAAGLVGWDATIVPLESEAMAEQLLTLAREPWQRSVIAPQPRSVAEYGADLVRSMS